VWMGECSFGRGVKRSTGHTHTYKENNTPDTDTHGKNNTPNPLTMGEV